MRARRIIQNGALGPEEVVLLQEVFDTTWKQIEYRYSDGDEAREAAREWLASIIVALARSCHTEEASVLQKKALEVFDRNQGSSAA